MIDCYKVVLGIQSHSIIPIRNITGPGFIRLTKTQWELTAFLPALLLFNHLSSKWSRRSCSAQCQNSDFKADIPRANEANVLSKDLHMKLTVATQLQRSGMSCHPQKGRCGEHSSRGSWSLWRLLNVTRKPHQVLGHCAWGIHTQQGEVWLCIWISPWAFCLFICFDF